MVLFLKKLRMKIRALGDLIVERNEKVESVRKNSEICNNDYKRLNLNVSKTAKRIGSFTNVLVAGVSIGTGGGTGEISGIAAEIGTVFVEEGPTFYEKLSQKAQGYFRSSWQD